jgi:hypothetical protein
MTNKKGNIIASARFSDGAVAELRLEISLDKERRLWQIRLMEPEKNVTCFRETDLYKAMQALREHLEAKGGQLLCAGARPDVVPSGMSRDMGGGRKAYVIQLGKQATEIVDIFAYAEPAAVGTVQQQQKFVEAWWASLDAQRYRPRLRRESKSRLLTWFENLFSKSR